MTSTTPQKAPDMTLRDQDGREVSLRDRGGRTLVLYFYPKDDTPGCTTQACDMRDNWARFEARDDVELYGVSPDDAASHQKFRTRHELPFSLLVDENHRLADEFGLWVEKKNFGRTYWGVERSTVIIDADGTIRTILRNVKPDGHAQVVLDQLDS